MRKTLRVATIVYFGTFTFVLMPFAMYLEQAWLGSALLSVAILLAGFAGDPPKFSALVGLSLRPFPSLAMKHAQFENWLQFDLDWDEGRR